MNNATFYSFREIGRYLSLRKLKRENKNKKELVSVPPEHITKLESHITKLDNEIALLLSRLKDGNLEKQQLTVALEYAYRGFVSLDEQVNEIRTEINIKIANMKEFLEKK